MTTARDYERVARALDPAGGLEARMQAVVDGLWSTLCTADVSWVGFYRDRPSEPDDRRLVLGPHRDRPACSPIGMHGVCGRSLRERRTLVVEDVNALGDAYVACDPRDCAEIVVPLIDEIGVAWGVLDLDSERPGAFGAADADGLVRVLRAAGLLPGA